MILLRLKPHKQIKRFPFLLSDLCETVKKGASVEEVLGGRQKMSTHLLKLESVLFLPAT
jgi:hypothetical protein